MKKILFTCCIAVCVSSLLHAQTLYMPRDVKEAFANGTRAMDGSPGKNYWQNYAHYSIAITAMPPDRTVKGTEEITYVNNSPTALQTIVLRLTLNIHKPGVLRYNDADADYLTDGMHIDNLSIDGKTQTWKDPEGHSTWQNVRLPKALQSHDSIKISVDWHYEISIESNREGMIDSTTYFLAYFYPRVAVYDDYNGWNRFDFTDQQEFYNDFCDYDFTVTVPEKYVVWATGNLLNPNEVLQPEIAKRLQTSFTSDDVVHIATSDELASNNVTAHAATNTWKWKADYVPDVTICLSDHFVWDGGSVIVDDATKRRASVQSAFNDSAADFHHMVEFGKHSLDWLSHKWPGVPYPYPKTTIVQGYADMEYPMMVNDGTNKNLDFSRFVAEHEIAHTWFPFYMGINETRYGFMDEGWATTFEYLIGQDDLGKTRADNFYKQFRIAGWISDPSADEDLPIIIPANILRNQSYGNNAYGKPSLGYLAVKDMLGDDLFRKCLHEYIQRWNGKHPIPWDFFNSFNTSSGTDLNWFWNNWYFSNYYIDLAVQSATKNKKGYAVTIQNIGGFAAPVNVIATYEDGSKDTIHQTAMIWKDNQKQATIQLETKKKIKTIDLDGGIFMDADKKNNTYTVQ